MPATTCAARTSTRAGYSSSHQSMRVYVLCKRSGPSHSTTIGPSPKYASRCRRRTTVAASLAAQKACSGALSSVPVAEVSRNAASRTVAARKRCRGMWNESASCTPNAKKMAVPPPRAAGSVTSVRVSSRSERESQRQSAHSAASPMAAASRRAACQASGDSNDGGGSTLAGVTAMACAAAAPAKSRGGKRSVRGLRTAPKAPESERFRLNA